MFLEWWGKIYSRDHSKNRLSDDFSYKNRLFFVLVVGQKQKTKTSYGYYYNQDFEFLSNTKIMNENDDDDDDDDNVPYR